MPLWNSPVTRMPRLRSAPLTRAAGAPPAAFPVCTMRGGLCDALLETAPLAIIGLQFIRDARDMVQDAVVIFANSHAERVFGGRDGSIVGRRFLHQCEEIMLAGIWQRCLWVSAKGTSETLVETMADENGDARLLSIAPFGDGLILCRSIEAETTVLANAV